MRLFWGLFSLAALIGGLVFIVNWGKSNVKNTPLVAILPHHNLVLEQRQKFLQELSKKTQPSTIILLSPNHFNLGSASALTSNHTWLVANGTKQIEPDNKLIDELKKLPEVEITDVFIGKEHGITNLLSEIKDYFPDSKIVPLVFRQDAPSNTVNKVFNNVFELCGNQCGVLASVDMSHYQTASIARIHDELTLRALTNLDEQEIYKAEVDSNQSLLFTILWAKKLGLTKFNLFAHTNSGLIADNPETETTTHIFGDYTTGKNSHYQSSVTFTFAGDGMFGRYIGNQFQENKFKDLFSDLGDRTFWGTDISEINLEGPISDKEITQSTAADNLNFNFSRQTIDALKFLKLTHLGLANNHTFNQGENGLKTTQKLLEDAGLESFGNPNEVSNASIARLDKNGQKLSLIGVNALMSAPGLDESIKAEKAQNRFVIVLPHWGNEYETAHSSKQEELARKWIKAGADLIIGSHPHVVEDAQVIEGKLVIYSLGNFVFDQFFSLETQRGLVVAGKLTTGKLEIVLLPIESRNLKPRIAKDSVRNFVLERVCANLGNVCQGDMLTIPLDNATNAIMK